MKELALKKTLLGDVENTCVAIGDAIKPFGFGILTRIDFDQKIKEKLGESIAKCVILGACNPKLALDAYRQNHDFALLLPCNIVVRELSGTEVSVEIMRPTLMMNLVDGIEDGRDAVQEAEKNLKTALDSLKGI